jgi:hypothetical protein
MPIPHRSHEPHSAPTIGLLIAADLQDNLMTATNDLERLQALLTHACDDLLQGFHGAIELVREREDASPDVRDAVLQKLSSAVTALQFQDMASQLIAHTSKRLRNCADRLAREAMADDEDGSAVIEEAPLRPNPVTQDEMDAGSIELF